jgi:hypothetical protein
VTPSSGEHHRLTFEGAKELLEHLRDGDGPTYLQFVGNGEFGQAWIAWEDGRLYFTSESGLRIADQSAFLFAQKCLAADAYTVHPVDRSAVAYLDEVLE